MDIQVATDSQGDIAHWQIFLGDGDVSIGTVSCGFPSTPGCDFSTADSVSPGAVEGAVLAEVSGDPGRWATIPEPSTGLLQITALLTVLGLASYRRGRGLRG